LKMALPYDYPEQPMSIRERSQMFETKRTQDPFSGAEQSSGWPPPLTRSYTTPTILIRDYEAAPPLPPRPQLNQITSISEEIIQKSRTGFLDLTEKGKVTFQQAGNSMNEIRDRLLKQPRSYSDSGHYTEDLLRPPGRKNRENLLIDFDSDDSEVESSPAASIRSAPEPTKLVDLDRKEV